MFFLTLFISSILTSIAFDPDFRQGFRIEFDTLIYTTFAPRKSLRVCYEPHFVVQKYNRMKDA